jgi:hypothetical protein
MEGSMVSVSSHTFAVDRVEPAREPLPELPYPQAVARHISGGDDDDLPRQVEDYRRTVAETERELAAAHLPEDRRRLAQMLLENARSNLPVIEQALLEARPPEACSRYHGRLVAGLENHPFLAAVARAYADHRPLVLSPDMVWLLIAQGVAAHVNVHAEEFRTRFVRHAGQRDLVVSRNDFCPGSPENPWPEVFSAFSAQVAQHVGPRTHNFFVPSFSTTGATERAAFEVTLLDAMRVYFRYSVRIVCGIPNITLEGTPADWEEIASRAEWLDSVGLGRWRDALRPVLRQFVAASRGEIDRRFWQSIYRHTPPTCDFKPGKSPQVTGWVVIFFPYLRDHSGGARVPARWLRDGIPAQGLSPGGQFGFAGHDLAGGVSVAPFQLYVEEEVRKMEFLAGFLGVAQDPASLALRPEIGWAVRQAPPPRAHE